MDQMDDIHVANLLFYFAENYMSIFYKRKVTKFSYFENYNVFELVKFKLTRRNPKNVSLLQIQYGYLDTYKYVPI